LSPGPGEWGETGLHDKATSKKVGRKGANGVLVSALRKTRARPLRKDTNRKNEGGRPPTKSAENLEKGTGKPQLIFL